MRILRIIYEWPPPWQGLAPHPYELTIAQSNMGHVVDVFCGWWPKSGPIEEYPNVKIHPFIREPLPATVSFTTSLLMLVYFLMWPFKNKVDIIHCHGHFAIWIYLYRLILQKFSKDSDDLKIPLVVHFHNTVAGRWKAAEEKEIKLKWYTKYIQWPIEKMANKWAVKTANAMIFVSEENKKEAIEYYKADANKCFVVETGVNVNTFKPTTLEERDKSRVELGFDSYEKIILNNGSMVERKNIHLIVESLAYLPDTFKLLMVGPGDPEYLTRINEIIETNHLGGRVTKIGYTPYPQIPIAFQVADIFVLPSSFEGLPKVVMQSLACEVPVLASGFRVMDQIDGLYYLDNLDPKYIAESIMQILENPRRVDRFKIVHSYSWEVKARQLEEVYKFVLRNIANTGV